MIGEGKISPTSPETARVSSGESNTLSMFDNMNNAVPQSHKNDNDAFDKFIAKDFEKLSIDDRSRVDKEVDGTHCMVINETAELLESSLAKLEIELESIPYKKKVAYMESQKLPRTHINDPHFRLRFLRSQLFDEREAAARLVKHCDFVLELFGAFALQREVELSDFNNIEMKWLMKGYVQFLPFRDQSGRRVIMQIMDSNVLREQITRLKIYYYMAMVASEDIESQRKGLVLVVWPGGRANDWKKRQPGDSRARHLNSQRHEVIPMRFAGYHYCMSDNPIFRLIRSFAVLFMGGIGGGMRSRMRFHVGVDIQLRYMLHGYGIPVDLIPVTGSGNIKLNFLKQWVHVRKAIETEARLHGITAITGRPMSEIIVECPGSNDVIFKPGKRMIHHPGNKLFQELILSRSNEYTSTSSKRGLYRWLIREIRVERKGRFLKWDDNEYWTELEDDSLITVKISTSCKAVLGKQKRSSKAAQNETAIHSSTYAFKDHARSQTDCDNKRRRCDDFDILPCARRT